MTDYETLSLITTIIGLVISAISLGIHIGNKEKNKNPILQTGGKLCLLELEQNIGYNPS